MSFVETDPASHNGENTWFTPKEFIEKLGPFDVDPCTVSFRPFNTAAVHFEHDKGECGLVGTWQGRVWLNPPYGKSIMPFIEKFIDHKNGVMLIFARMGSEGVQSLIRSGAFIYCLRKRVKFIHKAGNKVSNAGTDSLLVFFNLIEFEKVKHFDGVLISGLQTKDGK